MIPGTVQILGPLGPSATTDVYPTHKATYGLGGHHDVATYTERNDIPPARREEGMTCYVASDQSTWQLQNGITDSDWTDITVGGTRTLEVNHTFYYGDATPVIIWTYGMDTTVRYVTLSIDTAFDGTGAQIKVGDSAHDDILMSSGQNLPGEVGAYETTPMRAYTSGAHIVLTIVPGSGATQGSGELKILF